MELKTILCPIDFSEFSARALRYAAAFAQQFGARIIAYHCVPSVMVSADYLQGIPAGWSDWNSIVTGQMQNFLAPCKLYNIEVVSKLEVGDPASRIIETATDLEVDLIVMGTHGLSGYESLLMGSVTNKVLHKVTVPVLAVCKASKAILSGDPDEPLLIGKILCAVDPRNVRLPMLSRVMSLARINRSTVFFMTVGEPAETRRVISDLQDLIMPEKEELCKLEFLQIVGKPVEEILKAIHLYDIDLIVMGHHNRTPSALEPLGSVALRVIPRSNCAVLVVRD